MTLHVQSSVPLLCISRLRYSYFLCWQTFGFLGFNWKRNDCFIREEFLKLGHCFKIRHELPKKCSHDGKRSDGRPTSDQSRASHSGGQLWLLQGSVNEGRGGVQAESSRIFSSVVEILLLHNTSRVRRPPLQLRLHSDHSPVHQLQDVWME